MNDSPLPHGATAPAAAGAQLPYRLAEMTTVEAATAVDASPLVIIPAGAFEQHGPGMPLATDTIRAEHVAELVASQLAGRAVIGPSLGIGVSPHHLAFAGTVSLSTATLAAVLRDYIDSLHRHGWRDMLVITGHGGNNATLTTVAQDLLVTHPGLRFAWTPLTSLAPDAVAAMRPSEVHGHSGEAETAQMLYLAPELVHEDRLTPGSVTQDDLDPLSRVARRGGHPALTVPYDRLSPNGVLGDPRRATTDDGRAIIDAAVHRIVTFAREWLDATG
ncbi:creatininase family protein [Streptomyces sp. NPDC048441]|uniref:creatininase family protein n=1 Tax=Streptomyces sp. NPDC048441 TaxID=3365552 RepID=UPI0037154357